MPAYSPFKGSWVSDPSSPLLNLAFMKVCYNAEVVFVYRLVFMPGRTIWHRAIASPVVQPATAASRLSINQILWHRHKEAMPYCTNRV